jgi:hypothetical protein
MKRVMQCTLLIPRLFWPHENAQSVWSGLELPGLAKLVGRSRAERFDPIAPEGWLCQAFEVEPQQDWPVAPLTLELDGGEPGDAYWLRADPAHLRMDRDRLVLVENGLFEITPEEAAAFVSALNAHFREQDIRFEAPKPKRWYARLPHAPRILTQTPSTAAGGDVRRFLPSGEDALVWHRTFNEIQMLLHEHPLNAAREQRGEPVVNSVWFWGGGTRTHVRGRPYDAVWTDDALAIALASVADATVFSCPGDAAHWLSVAGAQGGDASQLIVLEPLASAAAHQDSSAWQSGMEALERRWFAPLARALREGRLASVSLVTPGDASCWRFDATRADLLKFWRSARPWQEYA